jgi:hypothetical protein
MNEDTGRGFCVFVARVEYERYYFFKVALFDLADMYAYIPTTPCQRM